MFLKHHVFGGGVMGFRRVYYSYSEGGGYYPDGCYGYAADEAAVFAAEYADEVRSTKPEACTTRDTPKGGIGRHATRAPRHAPRS